MAFGLGFGLAFDQGALGPGLPPDPLELLSVGATGSGVYAGYTLQHMEPFNGSVAANLNRAGYWGGKYANNFSERDRRHTSDGSVVTYMDAYYPGYAALGVGAPITSAADLLSEAGGALTAKVRLATSEEIAKGGTRNPAAVSGGPGTSQRQFVAGSATFYNSVGWRGPRIFEARFSVNSPVAPGDDGSGGNFSWALWELCVRGGSEASPNVTTDREVDLLEDHSTGLWVNTETDGSSPFNVSSPITYSRNGTIYIIRATYSDTQLVVELYSDNFAAQLASRTMAYNAGMDDLIYSLIFGPNILPVAGSVAVNTSMWTAKQATTTLYSFRVWSAGTTLQPASSNLGAATVINYNGTGTLVLPSQTTIWGQSGLTEYFAFSYEADYNGPGRSGSYSEFAAVTEIQDALPAGVTYNSGTRTFSFSTTFSAQPGQVNLLVWPYSTSAGVCRPYKLPIIVKPRITLPSLGQVTAGGGYSLTIGRGAFDNGNCQNINDGNPGLIFVGLPSWLTWDPINLVLSGTAPSNFTGVTLTARCVNGHGDYTETTGNIALWTPTLADLTLSPGTATTGVPYTGTLSGVTTYSTEATQSTVTATSSDGATVTVSGSGSTRTLSVTFITAGATLTVTEALIGAANTPHVSTPSITVMAPGTGHTSDSTTITSDSSTLTADAT